MRPIAGRIRLPTVILSKAKNLSVNYQILRKRGSERHRSRHRERSVAISLESVIASEAQRSKSVCSEQFMVIQTKVRDRHVATLLAMTASPLTVSPDSIDLFHPPEGPLRLLDGIR